MTLTRILVAHFHALNVPNANYLSPDLRKIPLILFTLQIRSSFLILFAFLLFFTLLLWHLIAATSEVQRQQTTTANATGTHSSRCRFKFIRRHRFSIPRATHSLAKERQLFAFCEKLFSNPSGCS